MNDASTGQPTRHGSHFPATRWSVVLQARNVDDPAAAGALAELCRAYWYPVYSFLRRQGNAPHDAEDLTQGFFAALLERGSLATVDEAKGKLRSFLLVAVKRFAASQYERDHAQRRGGNAVHVPINTGIAEERYTAEPATSLAPDVLFEKQWALTLLDTVLAKLREDYARDEREGIFDALKERLSADGDPATLASVAEQLGMNEGAVKVAVHRLRQRYRRVLREQIELTVDSPGEVDAEIQHLFKVFGAPD